MKIMLANLDECESEDDEPGDGEGNSIDPGEWFVDSIQNQNNDTNDTLFNEDQRYNCSHFSNCRV
jgi:hypothetical protein